MLDLHSIVLKAMKNMIAEKMLILLEVCTEYEFQWFPDYCSSAEKFMKAGKEAIELFSSDHVLLRPAVEARLEECRNIFKDLVETVEYWYNKKKANSNEIIDVEDVFFDLYGRINSIQNFIDFDDL